MPGIEIEELVERLAVTPGRIAAATAGKAPEELAAPPADGEWSALAILAHLRASDDILSPRLVAMLVRDDPPLPSYDDRRWEQMMGYADQDFQELLAAFTFRRAELARALRRHAPQDWARSGRHEDRGRVTMLDVVRHIADHEAEHCQQIEALFGPHSHPVVG